MDVVLTKHSWLWDGWLSIGCEDEQLELHQQQQFLQKKVKKISNKIHFSSAFLLLGSLVNFSALAYLYVSHMRLSTVPHAS